MLTKLIVIVNIRFRLLGTSLGLIYWAGLMTHAMLSMQLIEQ